MKDASNFYRPSGTITPLGIVLVGLFGLAAAVIGGAAYGALIFYIPFIYLNALLTVGLAFGVGYLVAKAAEIGKVRNPIACAVAAFFFGVLADYVGWISWIFVASERKLLVVDPLGLSAVLASLGQEGVWNLFGWTPKGIPLFGIWLVELGILSLFAAFTAYSQLSPKAFCEGCKRWAKPVDRSPHFEPVTDAAGFRSAFEAGEHAGLYKLKPADQLDPHFTVFEVSACPTCGTERFVSGKVVKIETDEKGKESTKEEDLFQNFILPPEDHKEVSEVWFTLARVVATGTTPAAEPG